MAHMSDDPLAQVTDSDTCYQSPKTEGIPTEYNYPILRERLVFVSYIVSGLEIGYIL